MSKGIEAPTWALLSPSSLPDDSERANLLGSIVADFEHPLDNYIPDDICDILPHNAQAQPTEDTNFKVTLLSASGGKAAARLGDILKISLERDVKDELHLTSTKVRTYILKQQLKIFALLKKTFSGEILNMIDQAPSRNNGAVFMVVGIKTCFDAEISSQTAEERERTSRAALSGTSMLAEEINIPPMTAGELGTVVSNRGRGNADGTQVARGSRIFAIQYRLIKRRSAWFQTVRPKIADFDFGDHFLPEGNAMFGNSEDEGEQEDDGDDSDEDDEGDEYDPIQLGDLRHTWSLEPTDGGGVVMTIL